MTIFRLSDTETLIDRLLDILAGISRIIRHCALHDTTFYAMRSCKRQLQNSHCIYFEEKKKSVVLKVFHNLSGQILEVKM